ncbi:MAG: SO2930 family diheme c-type cytochrome [Erythrobacter sp.]
MNRSAPIFVAALLAMAGATVQSTARSPAPVNNAVVMGEGAGNKMPRTLSAYGFFADLREQHGTYGVSDYRLNTPLYSDGADKLRFIYLPAGTKLTADGAGLLQFPVGSAIIKTFAFGEGEDRQLIETRVLLHRVDGWTALPYRWNEDQTEATLALAGARIPLTRPDGAEISYRIPNKNQCKTCHSKDGEIIPIGPKLRNLSPEWLELMQQAEYLAEIPKLADRMPLWEAQSEVSLDKADVTALARAYLDVNCAHCHQPGGGASNSGLDLRWEQDDPHAMGIRKPPVAAGRGSGGYAVSIAPGDPDASIIIHRMSSIEPGIAMPELGKNTVDPQGVDIVRRWIAGMDQ